jgi:hypothetical protein
MKFPVEILDAARHCLHSEIAGRSGDLEPDYVCTLQGANGQPCKLLKEPYCTRHEPFPESYDQ